MFEKRRYAITCLVTYVNLTSQRVVSWTWYPQVLPACRQSGSTASSSSPGQHLLSARKAKRLFMSGKASDVHSEASWRPPQSSKSGQGITPGEFREMRREVDTFGETYFHFLVCVGIALLSGSTILN